MFSPFRRKQTVASLHGNSSRSSKTRGFIDHAHHFQTLVTYQQSHCQTCSPSGSQVVHGMSRSSLHKRDIKAHEASVKTCRFRSSFVAGLPTDNMLMGTGPDAAAMGNALSQGHGSLSKRAVNVPPARTNGKLSPKFGSCLRKQLDSPCPPSVQQTKWLCQSHSLRTVK